MKKNTSWGSVADWYDKLLAEDADSYQAKVILPNLLRLMEIKKGTRVLDIACGSGFFTKAFSEKGAVATGIDIAPELIAKAKKVAPKAAFFVAPADAIKKSADGSFEKATVVLALQNIENLDGAIKEAARSLEKNGTFYIVLNHPAFRIPQGSAWDFDEEKNVQYRRIDRYISESHAKIIMNPGRAESEHTLSFHRPLQIYFKSLAKNGFLVRRLEEWISHKKSGRGPRQAAEDRARKEIPLFLAIEAVKI